MLALDINQEEMQRLAAEFAATPRQVEMAQRRAVKRTAATLRRMASQGLKTDLGLRNTKILRRRIKEFRLDRSGAGMKIWVGANDMPLSSFKGRPRKVPGGIQFGHTTIYGAFLARRGGRRGGVSKNRAQAVSNIRGKTPCR